MRVLVPGCGDLGTPPWRAVAVYPGTLPGVSPALFLGSRSGPAPRASTAPRPAPLGAARSIVGLGARLWAIREGPAKGGSSAGLKEVIEALYTCYRPGVEVPTFEDTAAE